jgi:cell division cycle 14
MATNGNTLASELAKATEFIKGRLYFVSLTSPPKNTPSTHFICTDKSLIYWNFFLDFGPLNLGQVVRFGEYLNFVLNDPDHACKKIYYYSNKVSNIAHENVLLIISLFHLFFHTLCS